MNYRKYLIVVGALLVVPIILVIIYLASVLYQIKGITYEVKLGNPEKQKVIYFKTNYHEYTTISSSKSLDIDDLCDTSLNYYSFNTDYFYYKISNDTLILLLNPLDKYYGSLPSNGNIVVRYDNQYENNIGSYLGMGYTRFPPMNKELDN